MSDERLDRYIAAALTGLLANPGVNAIRQYVPEMAVDIAKRAVSEQKRALEGEEK
jgi:hypothetical protein